MNKLVALLVVLLLAISARAQIDTESIPPELDQRDLYTRAAASQVVIIGRVVKSEGRSERIPPEELLERLNKGRIRRGGLETVQVEEIVCQQSDFDSAAAKAENKPQPFYLFIPFDESDLPNGDFREEVLPNRRYLLLLSDRDSAALSSTYKLDPSQVYYRGTGHNRGVIPLEPESSAGRSHTPPEVVDKFRKLCAAMRPPKPEDKLALLRQLADSGDPVLEKEAEIATNAVKASMAKEQSLKQSHR